MSTTSPSEVVIGGDVAGLSAAVFTARHGLDTLVVDAASLNYLRVARHRQLSIRLRSVTTSGGSTPET